MFAAKPAILAHFQSVRIVFLVFHGVVVALLALSAGKGNFDSHLTAPPKSIAERPDFAAETGIFQRAGAKALALQPFALRFTQHSRQPLVSNRLLV